MAVLQVSQIQVRRGLLQELGQLSAGEFGWAIDKLRLFIGNGTTAEGSPYEGNSEILTSNSDILGLLGNYRYKGISGGYEINTQYVRTYQDKVDDIVNVKDFGALGDGFNDDSDAIQRAIDEIYARRAPFIPPTTRRTIWFNPGRYKITRPLLLPPYTSLRNAGKDSVIIELFSTTAGFLFRTTEATGNYENLGTTSVLGPVEISGITFASLSPTAPIGIIDSAKDVSFYRCRFQGSTFNSSLTSPNSSRAIIIKSSGNKTKSVFFSECDFSQASTLVEVDSFIGTSDVKFDRCTFSKAYKGLVVTSASTGTVDVKVTNSVFDIINREAIVSDSKSNGVVSAFNTFLNVGRAFGTPVTPGPAPAPIPSPSPNQELITSIYTFFPRIRYGNDSLQYANFYQYTQGTPRGIVFRIHGGSWRSTDVDPSPFLENAEMISLVNQGYSVLDINYRGWNSDQGSNGNGQFPNSVEDIKTVLRFCFEPFAGQSFSSGWQTIYSYIQTYGRNKVTVTGNSAGGHLAIMGVCSYGTSSGIWPGVVLVRSAPLNIDYSTIFIDNLVVNQIIRNYVTNTNQLDDASPFYLYGTASNPGPWFNAVNNSGCKFYFSHNLNDTLVTYLNMAKPTLDNFQAFNPTNTFITYDQVGPPLGSWPGTAQVQYKGSTPDGTVGTLPVAGNTLGDAYFADNSYWVFNNGTYSGNDVIPSSINGFTRWFDHNYITSEISFILSNLNQIFPPIATFRLAANYISLNEGDEIVFKLITTNVNSGTQYPYTLTGISAADIVGGSLSGNLTVGADGNASIVVSVTEDSLTEGSEAVVMSAAGQTISVIINDTSKTPAPPITINLDIVSPIIHFGGNLSYSIADIHNRIENNQVAVEAIKYDQGDGISISSQGTMKFGRSHQTIGKSVIFPDNSSVDIPLFSNLKSGTVNYSVERGIRNRSGTINFVLNNSNGNISFYETYNELEPLGVDINIVYNSSLPFIRCIADNSGNASVITYDIKSLQQLF